MQNIRAISFSTAFTLLIISRMESSSKATLVTVVKSPSITTRSVVSFLSLFAQARARPMRAPVSSSWSAAVSAVFPHTPAFPVHPLHPAVCSH